MATFMKEKLMGISPKALVENFIRMALFMKENLLEERDMALEKCFTRIMNFI